MNTPWRRPSQILCVLCALSSLQTSARANDHLLRAIGLSPTEYVTTIPTTYAVSSVGVIPTVYTPTVYTTSYYVSTPATYVVPTVYAETPRPVTRAYFEQPVYLARSYVVPTAYYYPTSYVYPTYYSAAVVDPCATSEPTPAGYSGGAGEASPTSGSRKTPKAPPKTLESSAARGSSTATSLPEPPAGTNRDKPGGVTPAEVDMNVPSPPAAPAPEKDAAAGGQPGPFPPITPNLGGASPPAPVELPTTGKPPVAPNADVRKADASLTELGAEEARRREVQKPVVPTVATRPFLRSESKKNLNVLEGKVVSGDSGQGEEEVRVVFSNRNGTVPDRTVSTDAYGRYAVRLPDGDWTVNVTTRGGRTYAVSQLLVSGGQITDDGGRSVPSLTITR